MSYVFVFWVAFVSATLLPLGSEGVLVYYAREAGISISLLWFCATMGNTLGSLTNWLLGRYLIRYEDRKWFPINSSSRKSTEAFFSKYGKWSLLLVWLPIIGDALAVVAGVLKTPFWWFFVLVFLGKASRYALILWGHYVFFS
ncbi:DedA family protein [Marinomonas sp. C2222]|uniref:DedA family protein n=1 Tax=Marinomonas sargassi TaxID=2984494 RepID=A0ABT2YRD8_9GAMM|nr:YqaA family protein [Marinomonas sargassi]MCV2402453.1 DedA family protein [Marinomonas sargassi]